jgi:hypothetical protein
MQRWLLLAALLPAWGGATACTASGDEPMVTGGPEIQDAGPEAETAFDTPDVDFHGLDEALLADPCNGWPGFCDRRYDEMTIAATHASVASDAVLFRKPTQHRDIRKQLDDGIRGLFLEAHQSGADIVLCAGACSDGSLQARTALEDVRAFLEVNPREIVTMVVETSLPAAEVAAVFSAAALDTQAVVQSRAATWPTLGELIQSGKRLVVLSEGDGERPSWLLSLWDFAWSTSATLTAPEQMDCSLARGNRQNPLQLVRHYLVPDTPDGGAREDSANIVNANPFLMDHLRACQVKNQRAPGLVAVDFYDVGDVVMAARNVAGGP